VNIERAKMFSCSPRARSRIVASKFARCTNARRAGFTLLELLLAMTAAALLALSLYASMSIAIRAQRTAQRTVQSTRAGAIASDLIRTDLSSLPPPSANSVLAGPFVGTHQPGGGGDNDDLVFYTLGIDRHIEATVSNSINNNDTNPEPLAEGIREVELVVRTDVSPPVLVRRIQRNLLAQTQPPPEEEILCRDVRSFSLRYWDGTAWQETWDSTQQNDTLPLAVGVTIQINDPLSRVLLNGQPMRQIQQVIPIACGKSAADATAGATQ